MKITGLNKEGKEVYLQDIPTKNSERLGSGALTGTIESLTSPQTKRCKNIMTYIDVKELWEKLLTQSNMEK